MHTKSPPRRAALVHLTVLLAYLFCTIVMTWPLARHITTAIPGDGFDGWQNYWNLWWMKVALVERVTNPLVTDLLYAPTGVSLYFHTLNPFNGLVTLPIQLSADLIVAYNSVVLLSWTLAGYGTYLLTRWLLRHPTLDTRHPTPDTRHLTLDTHLPPFLAGLIFTFAPFHMAHLLGHMQVMSVQWIPFYALVLLRGLDRRRNHQPWLGDALLAGLFLVLVGLCDWYFVLYLFFFTGLLIAWHWTADAGRAGLAMVRRKSLRVGALVGETLRALARWFVPPLVAGLVFLIVLSPLLIPMVREAMQFSFMVRPASDLYILSAAVADFLIPNRLHTLFRPTSFSWIGNQIAPVSERTIAIGYVPLLLTLAAIALDRKRSGFWLASALFFFVMALGPSLHLWRITWDDVPAQAATTRQLTGWTPYAVLNRLVPFMRISRSVSRYALMVQFSLAVTAGVGLAALLQRWRGQGRWQLAWTVALFLSLLVLAEYWVAPYPLSPPDTPPFYRELRTLPGAGSVLNLPMNFDRPGYLLYQTEHGKPLTVAYISRDDPRTLTERVPVLQHFRHLGPDILAVDPVAVGQSVLHDLGIDYVILDRYKMPGGEERTYTTDLATAIFGNQAPLFEDERLTVYRVPQDVEPAPYLGLGPLNWGPLHEAENGTRRRALLGNRATVSVHAPDALPDALALHIRYRTDATTSLHVRPLRANSADALTLPPAPDGAVGVLPLHQAQEADNPIMIEFVVEIDGSTASLAKREAREQERVWIEELRLGGSTTFAAGE